MADASTLRRHGTDWYTLLTLKRWHQITDEELDNARVIGHGLPIKDDHAA